MPSLFFFNRYKIGIWISCLLLALGYKGFSTTQAIVVDGKNSFVYFYTAGYATYWEDTASQPDLQRAILAYNRGNFRTPRVQNQLGLSKNGFWVAIPISNTSQQEARLFLEMQNLHINDVRFYLISSKGYLLYNYKTGDMLPFEERPILLRNFVFPVNIAARKSVTCFLYLKNDGEGVSLPLFLHDQSTYSVSEGLFISAISIIIGLLAAMGIWAMVLYSKRKEISYLNYFFYITALIGWMISNYGIGFMYLWPNHPLWQQVLPSLLGLTSYMLFMNFGYGFFQIGTWKGWIKWAYWGVFSGGILVQIILIQYPLVSKSMPSMWILEILMLCMLISQFVMIATIAAMLKRKITVAITLFTLAYFSSVVSGLMVLLREMIPMPVNLITEHGMLLGWVLEALLLAMSMATMLESQLRERHQLLKEQQQHQKDLLSAEVKTRAEESERIAADLHDDMGMLLTSAHHFINHQKYEEARKTIVQSMEKMRQITHSLHPSEVNAFGLDKVLEEMAANLSTRETIIEYSSRLPFDLKDEKAVIIYRCISEILNNTLRHAHATYITIAINYMKKNIHIAITDNGIGFDTLTKPIKGLGLKNVESRVQYLGGEFILDSRPGKGTEIVLNIPFSNYIQT